MKQLSKLILLFAIVAGCSKEQCYECAGTFSYDMYGGRTETGTSDNPITVCGDYEFSTVVTTEVMNGETLRYESSYECREL